MPRPNPNPNPNRNPNPNSKPNPNPNRNPNPDPNQVGLYAAAGLCAALLSVLGQLAFRRAAEVRG